MSENEILGMVVGAIVVVVGLGTAIAVPLMKATATIQKLIDAVNVLTDKFDKFELNNHDAHKRMWVKNDEQDDILMDHEARISVLEKG